jgi:glycosyltransferase involved in cell wall biosynthesis
VIEKRILINAVSAKSGGAKTYVLNLAQQLADEASPHHYIFYVPPGIARVIRGLSPQFRIVESLVGERPFWKRFVWDQFSLRRIVKCEQIDVLISSSDFGMFFPPCIQILLIRNSLFFSQLYQHTLAVRQSVLSRMNLMLRRWHVLLSAQHSDIVMTASGALLEEIQRYAKGRLQHAVVNPFGVPLNRFGVFQLSRVGQEQSFERHERLRLLHVSEYCDYKNVTVLLKATRILSRHRGNTFCLLSTASPWQYPDIYVVTREEDQHLAKDSQIAPFVTFTNTIPYEDIPQLYANSDIFVFPSITESFAHPLVEAMASGIPILASDISLCHEICGDAAIYFDPLDAADLATKITFLSEHKDLRNKLAEKGRERVHAGFDWKEHVHRLSLTIERAVAYA